MLLMSFENLNSCEPPKEAVFYSIGRAYRFGRLWLLGKGVRVELVWRCGCGGGGDGVSAWLYIKRYVN